MANRRHVDSNRSPARGQRRAPKARNAAPVDTAETGVDASPDVSRGFDDAEDVSADLAFDERDDTGSAAERLAADGEIDEELSEELGVDNIVGPLEAGLGGGLDQAEEALAGITDEELAEKARRR